MNIFLQGRTYGTKIVVGVGITRFADIQQRGVRVSGHLLLGAASGAVTCSGGAIITAML